MNSTERTSLRELALLFLRLGTTAFGGPAVHIAMMQAEVLRRRWMTEERFLDLLGATNLIPGPNSTEMAIHIGWERRRWAGLVVAGMAFILPAAVVTLGLGWAYVRFGSLPEVGWLLYGMKPAILAVVVQAIWSLGRKAVKPLRLKLLGAAALCSAALGANELIVLLGTGVISVALSRRAAAPSSENRLLQIIPFLPGVVGVAATKISLSSVFFLFLKIGSVLFGSGYVLLAFLRTELVDRLGWLTEAQVIDAIGVGQVTPGPLFTTATFVGYLLAGTKGALAATAGIFLPAFLFVALSAPLVPRLRSSSRAADFLDGVNVASLALMTVVTVQLGRTALVDVLTVAIGVVSAVLVIRFRVISAWVVLCGGLAGWAGMTLLRGSLTSGGA